MVPITFEGLNAAEMEHFKKAGISFKSVDPRIPIKIVVDSDIAALTVLIASALSIVNNSVQLRDRATGNKTVHKDPSKDQLAGKCIECVHIKRKIKRCR